MPSAGTTGWSLGWLADWLKPATPLQTRTNEPRDCPERNWSTGTGVVLPRSWTWTTTWVQTWTAGEIRRPTLHVKYCTIKCRTHRSQSIPPYLHVPSPPLSLSLQRSPRLLLCYSVSFFLQLSGRFSVSLRIRSAGNLVSLIESSMPSHC